MSPGEASREGNFLERSLWKVGQFITGYGSQTFAGLGAAAFALAPVFESWSTLFVGSFGVGVALTLLGVLVVPLSLRPSYWTLRRKYEEEQALNERRAASLQECLDALGRALLRELGKHDSEHRISVYDERDGEFVLLSRWSESPTLRRLGRHTFPLDQGAIGVAWANGIVARERLYMNREKWNEQQSTEYSIPEEVAPSLTMHARSIAAIRLHSEAQPVGVLVLESLLPTLYALESFRDAVESSAIYSCIGEILGQSRIFVPTVHEIQNAAVST